MNEFARQSGTDSVEAKSQLLQRFRGPVEERDTDVVEFWRNAPPAAHAQAMIELAQYAERMVALTGLGKDPDEPLAVIPITPPTQPPQERKAA